MRTTMCILLAAATLPACKWTEFDDLEKDTWVDSTTKPDVKSSDWGVTVQRGASAGDSSGTGTLAIIGAGPGTYSELQYNAEGSSSLQASSTSLLSAQGILSLDAQPILLASPTSSEVALVTTGDSASVVVATGTHTVQVRQLFINNTSLGVLSIPSTPDAAIYIQPPPFPGNAMAAPAPLIGITDILLGTIVSPPAGSKQPACKITDGGAQIQIRALAPIATTAGQPDDVLVWNGADGKLLRYPGSVFNGCATQAPIGPAQADANKTATKPGHGSQLLPLSGGRVLLQGHVDIAQGDASILQVYDVATLAPVGNAVMTAGMRQAAVLDVGATQYAVVGMPTAQIDGKAAGQVLVYAIGATGLEATPVATLHDAQPDATQSFGRSVTVMPYRGKNVIAVGADNEVFVYFRLNREDGTSLYDETRQVQ